MAFDTFKFEFNVVVPFTLNVPIFDVFPVINKLFDKFVGPVIVRGVELIVAFAEFIVKLPDIVVPPWRSYVPVPV